MTDTGGLDLENEIYAALQPVLTGGIGVYYIAPPDNTTPPYVTFQRISTQFDSTLQATSQMITAFVQVDVYGKTGAQVGSLSEIVRLALSGLRTANGPERKISMCTPENDFVGYEWEQKLHRRTQLFRVMMREASAAIGGGGGGGELS